MQRVRLACGHRESATDQSHSSMGDESGAQHGPDLPLALSTSEFLRRGETSQPATESTQNVGEGCQNVRFRFASISLASVAARSVAPESELSATSPSGGIKWPWRNLITDVRSIKLINWDVRLPFFKDADPHEAMTALNHVYAGTWARTLSQVPTQRE